jgi:hypothetical protein
LRNAVELKPDFADAQANQSMCFLLAGDYERGWRQYEWRWKVEPLMSVKRDFAQPLWLGDAELNGRTLLVHAEQGLGDTLQFCRYVPLLAAAGAKVVLQVPRPLQSLLSTVAQSATVIALGEPLPEFDFHCPVMSLPLAFDTRLETIPTRIPYLYADESKARAWRDALGPRTRSRVGLVWAGNPRKDQLRGNHLDRMRSLRFEQLEPLLGISAVDFYSLQLGADAIAQLRAHALCARVIDRTEALKDFSDTAALMENLDLVISVDTSVVHLAGALGKPFWLLNRFNTCWRWLLDREDSPWYPTARIFRQPAFGDWDSVLAETASALDAWKNTRRGGLA